MNFLNVGPWELSVILVIAILMIGPKRMVEIVRTLGRITAQVRKMSNEFMGTIQTEMQAAERDVRQTVDGGLVQEQDPIANLSAEIKALGRDTRRAVDEIAADVDGVVKGEQKASHGR